MVSTHRNRTDLGITKIRIGRGYGRDKIQKSYHNINFIVKLVSTILISIHDIIKPLGIQLINISCLIRTSSALTAGH